MIYPTRYWPGRGWPVDYWPDAPAVGAQTITAAGLAVGVATGAAAAWRHTLTLAPAQVASEDRIGAVRLGAGVKSRMWGSYGTGDGQFDLPNDVAVAADGSVYVADYGNGRIQKFDADGVFVAKWGLVGAGTPAGVAVGPDGSVYVTDVENHSVQKFTAAGVLVLIWGAAGIEDSAFNAPYGIAVTPDGSVYVADVLNQRIQKFNEVGNFIAKWGSYGTGDGEFDLPVDVAVGPDGSVYVADTNNHRVQKFDADGVFVAKWGVAGVGDGQLNLPYGIAVAPDGLVYVVDTENYRLQVFDADGGFLRKWGNFGTGNDQFNGAVGVALDADGNVYVADTNNHRVQKFDPHWIGLGAPESLFHATCSDKTPVLALRFADVRIPPGATVQAATLALTVAYHDDPQLAITCEDADNAAALSDLGGFDLSGRTPTSAARAWDGSDLGGDAVVGGANFRLTSPDFAPGVKEVVDRGGWAAGNALAVRLTDAGTGGGLWAYGLDAVSGLRPALTVRWTWAGSAQTVPAAGLAVAVGYGTAALAGVAVGITADGLDVAVACGEATVAPALATIAAEGLDVPVTVEVDGGEWGPDEVMPGLAPNTVTFTITEDGHQVTATGVVNIASSTLLCNNANGWTAFRVQNLNIPKGATIQDAHLSLKTATNDDPKLLIFCEDSSSPAALTTAANNISARTRTATSTSWVAANLGTGFKNSPSFAPQVQAVIARSDWVQATSDLAIIWQNQTGGSLKVYSGNSTALNRPVLSITWYVSAVTQTIAPNGLAVAVGRGTATVGRGTVGVTAAGLAVGVTYGTAALHGTRAVTANGLAVGVTFGTLTAANVVLEITAAGLAVGVTTGAGSVIPVIAGGGLAVGVAAGTATVAPGTRAVTAAGLAVGVAAGTATVAGRKTLTAAGLAVGVAAGTATVVGRWTVTAEGLAVAVSIGAARVVKVITAAGTAVGVAAGTATMTSRVAAAGLAVSVTTGAATAAPGTRTITAAGLAVGVAAGTATAGQVITAAGLAVGVTTGTATMTETFQVIVAAGLAVGVAAGTATVDGPVTPEERRLRVGAEDRVMSVTAEDRLMSVAAEDRTMGVAAEDRTMGVAADDRVVDAALMNGGAPVIWAVGLMVAVLYGTATVEV